MACDRSDWREPFAARSNVQTYLNQKTTHLRVAAVHPGEQSIVEAFDVEVVVLTAGGDHRYIPEGRRIASDRRQNVVAKWPEEHVHRAFDEKIERRQRSDRARAVRVAIVDPKLIFCIQMLKGVDRLYAALVLLASVDEVAIILANWLAVLDHIDRMQNGGQYFVK